LSAFEINGRQYVCHPMAELGHKNMAVALGDVFASKTTFTYQYDFGSTTHLAGRVISDTNAPYRSEALRLLARNHPPEIPCGVCGKPAELLCLLCSYGPEGWFCRACMPKHDCPEADPDLFHPIVNSPRVGVCGYTG
jgi:hypothetical protein